MVKVFYGQELYNRLDLQEYKRGQYKVGQLASNGLDWGIIEGFLDGKIVVRVPLPGNFIISQHEKQQGFADAICAYEAWEESDIVEFENRDIVKILKAVV